jgi:hypothetical protein
MKTIRPLIICLAFIALLGLYLQARSDVAELRAEAELVTDCDRIPSLLDIQQKLCEAGYPVAIDGRYGPETATQWDRYSCDRYAKEYFK